MRSLCSSRDVQLEGLRPLDFHHFLTDRWTRGVFHWARPLVAQSAHGPVGVNMLGVGFNQLALLFA